MKTQRVKLEDGREVAARYEVMKTSIGPVRVRLDRATFVEGGEPVQVQTPEHDEVFAILQRLNGFA